MLRCCNIEEFIERNSEACCNDDQGRVYQNCKYHESGGRGAWAWQYKSNSEKCIISVKVLSTPRYRWYSNDDQGKIYQNCEFHDPRGWVSCTRRGHIRPFKL